MGKRKADSQIVDLMRYERQLWQAGLKYVVGVDEAGRGPLAGPVVAGAVIFEPETMVPGLNDSKKLTEKQRTKLFDQINEQALAVGIGRTDPADIDRVNILEASRLAMIDALSQLSTKAEHVLIDGRPFREFPYPNTAIVRGDALSFSIAAASIMAKVTRDRLMLDFHQQYPVFEFDQHKGYPSQRHLELLRKHGPCPIHRRSFRGVRELVEAHSQIYVELVSAVRSAKTKSVLEAIGNRIARHANELSNMELRDIRQYHQQKIRRF